MSDSGPISSGLRREIDELTEKVPTQDSRAVNFQLDTKGTC